jgi:hypothetical protein
MSALDDLRSAVVAQQDLAEKYRTAADQSTQDCRDARQAWVWARQAFLRAIAPRRVWVDGTLIQDPTWTRPSEAELDELRETIKSRGSEYDECEEIARAAATAAEDAENELAVLEHTWPSALGPFPKRNP